jgi:hypothetical protein
LSFESDPKRQHCARAKHQVSYRKQTIKRKLNQYPAGGGGSVNNPADEVICLMNGMMEKDAIVKKMSYSNDGTPYWILFEPYQIQLINSLCRAGVANPACLGIDRTFNLSPYFVTVTVFQHPYLRNTENSANTHPVLLGPVMLHKEAKQRVYTEFLKNLETEIQIESKETLPPIIICSDEESALENSIEAAFPAGTSLLCSIHLKKNLEKKANEVLSCREARTLVSCVYGQDGLIRAKTARGGVQ